VGFPATQRCVAEHPVLIFLQVRAGRVKLIEFLRSGSRSTCGLWHTLGGTRERERAAKELLLLTLQGEWWERGAAVVSRYWYCHDLWPLTRAALISLDNYTKENLSFH
jgi:hypothetical protein